MPNLTAGITPQPYGQGGRFVVLPVKAGTQIYQGSMVSQINGACVPATTAGAGNVVGIAAHDMLGGATDGATRITVWYDKIFIMSPGVAAPTDTTPFGTVLFAETDNTIGTGALGVNAGIAGVFVGIEDDGRVRILFNTPQGLAGGVNNPTFATPLTDVPATTVNRAGRYTIVQLNGTMSQNDTITLGTTNAEKGDIIRLVRNSVSAFTVAVVNGGVGGGTLATLVASKPGFVEAYFDGANWNYFASSAT